MLEYPPDILDEVNAQLEEEERAGKQYVAEAVETLRAHLPVRLVTNTTSVTHRTLADRLLAQGLLDAPENLLTPLATAHRVLAERGHTRGLLLASDSVREELAWFTEDPSGDTVLLATEGHDRRIEDLQPAFRRLLDGAHLYAMQRNRYYRRGDELATDLGPVAAFLQCASRAEPQTLGKPSPLLFDAIAEQAGCERSQLVMAGDDVEFDASESVKLGMAGVLVRTGKYREGDEARVDPVPTATLASVVEIPGWIGL
jgi:HAD superfamily hydrolase (TIGR01458 family)